MDWQNDDDDDNDNFKNILDVRSRLRSRILFNVQTIEMQRLINFSGGGHVALQNQNTDNLLVMNVLSNSIFFSRICVENNEQVLNCSLQEYERERAR